jgi:acyl dehydratase
MNFGCTQEKEQPAPEMSGAPAESQEADSSESKFLTLYPGMYVEKEKAPVAKYIADNRALEEKGGVNIQALVEGKLPEDTPGVGPTLEVTETMVRYFNQLRDPENPILNDAVYARNAGYKDIIAYPTFAAHDDSFMVPYPPEGRDTLLVADLIHSVTNHRPVYPGDTLYFVNNSRHFKDITPEEGSIYRSNYIVNKGSVYNQNAEKILDVTYTVEENIKVYKEGLAPENPGFEDMWEERARGGDTGGEGGGSRSGGKPEGAMPGGGGGRGGGGQGSTASYYYTDEDWEVLKGLWANEKRRGAAPLYWEDVNIGDMPPMTLEGPAESAPAVAVPWGMGLGGNRSVKSFVLDPEKFKTMVRSEEDGIYRPADEDAYILPVPEEAQTGMAFGAMGEMDAVLSGVSEDIGPAARGGAPGGGMPEGGAAGRGMPEGGMPEGGGRDGGPPGGEGGRGDGAPGGGGGGGMMNFTRRDYAIRHIHDWIGDQGWLYNIRWGGLFSKDMYIPGEPSPAINPDAPSFLDKVPENVLTRVNVLGDGRGDSKFMIVRSYVYDKYVKNGEGYVDIIWWIESIGGGNWGEGGATVKLPMKNG